MQTLRTNDEVAAIDAYLVLAAAYWHCSGSAEAGDLILSHKGQVARDMTVDCYLDATRLERLMQRRRFYDGEASEIEVSRTVAELRQFEVSE